MPSTKVYFQRKDAYLRMHRNPRTCASCAPIFLVDGVAIIEVVANVAMRRQSVFDNVH